MRKQNGRTPEKLSTRTTTGVYGAIRVYDVLDLRLLIISAIAGGAVRAAWSR